MEGDRGGGGKEVSRRREGKGEAAAAAPLGRPRKGKEWISGSKAGRRLEEDEEATASFAAFTGTFWVENVFGNF